MIDNGRYYLGEEPEMELTEAGVLTEVNRVPYYGSWWRWLLRRPLRYDLEFVFEFREK